MKDAMVLRNGLGPYIYTAVRKAYDVGVGLLRPMYYSFPEDEESYAFQATQYMFGDEMLIAPITEAAPAPVNATVTKSVWLPEGTWTDWVSGVATNKRWRYKSLTVKMFLGAVCSSAR